MKVNLGMNVNGLHVLIMLKSKDTWKFACCHEQNEQVIGFLSWPATHILFHESSLVITSGVKGLLIDS